MFGANKRTVYYHGIVIWALMGVFMLYVSYRNRVAHAGATNIVVRFSDAHGLSVGTPVFLAGKNIGRVGEMVIDGRDAKLTIEVVPDIRVRKGVRVESAAANLLGGRKLELKPTSRTAPYLEDGADVGYGVNYVGISELGAHMAPWWHETSIVEIAQIVADALRVRMSMKLIMDGREDKVAILIERMLSAVETPDWVLNETIRTLDRSIETYETFERLLPLLESFKANAEDAKQLYGEFQAVGGRQMIEEGAATYDRAKAFAERADREFPIDWVLDLIQRQGGFGHGGSFWGTPDAPPAMDE